jgi:hypothetical protein
MKRLRLFGAFVLALGVLSVVAVAPAQAAESRTTIHGTVIIMYEPGSSSAIRPAVNTLTQKVTYKCVFAGWRSGIRVDWDCNLVNAFGVFLSGHSGNFNGGTYETLTFSHPYQQGKTYCTDAFALSVDGGDSDKKCM